MGALTGKEWFLKQKEEGTAEPEGDGKLGVESDGEGDEGEEIDGELFAGEDDVDLDEIEDD